MKNLISDDEVAELNWGLPQFRTAELVAECLDLFLNLH